jgi:hypothetical protein
MLSPHKKYRITIIERIKIAVVKKGGKIQGKKNTREVDKQYA